MVFNNKKNLYFLWAGILLSALFILSLCVGKYPMTPTEIFKIIFGMGGDELSINVFYTLRLPRAIMVILSGFSLSLAGSIYQSIFKNPLASPDIIGISSGANAGAAFAIVVFGGGTVFLTSFAFLGGIVAVFLVIALSRFANEDKVATFILAGVIISSISTGIIMTLKYFADPERQLAPLEFWAMGSFANVTAEKLLIVVPTFIIGVTVLFLMRWKINVLSLSDDEAQTLGVNVAPVRIIILLFSTLLVASTLSVTGLISFIGLIAPHISRRIMRDNSFKTAIFSGLIGGIILTIADCVSRVLLASELPISILTSFIGAPYLCYLIIRGNRSGY